MPVTVKRIQRALRSIGHIAKNMRIYHSSFNIFMSEKALDFPDIDAILKQMCCKAVAQCMNSRAFYYTRLPQRIPYCKLNGLIASVL